MEQAAERPESFSIRECDIRRVNLREGATGRISLFASAFRVFRPEDRIFQP